MLQLNRKQLIRAGVMLVVTFLITWLLRLDVPSITRPVGKTAVDAGVYATLGDICIYPSVLLLGVPMGAVVSALGAALADLAVGAARAGTASNFYIIGSILIKGGMAFFVAAFAKKCDDWKKCFAVAGMTEALMVVAYLVYDVLIVREFGVAGKDFLVNLGQGLVCMGIGGVILHYLPVVQPRKMPEAKRRSEPKTRVYDDHFEEL